MPKKQTPGQQELPLDYGAGPQEDDKGNASPQRQQDRKFDAQEWAAKKAERAGYPLQNVRPAGAPGFTTTPVAPGSTSGSGIPGFNMGDRAAGTSTIQPLIPAPPAPGVVAARNAPPPAAPGGPVEQEFNPLHPHATGRPAEALKIAEKMMGANRQGRGFYARQEAKLSPEGMNTLYTRGNAASVLQNPIQSGPITIGGATNGPPSPAAGSGGGSRRSAGGWPTAPATGLAQGTGGVPGSPLLPIDMTGQPAPSLLHRNDPLFQQNTAGAGKAANFWQDRDPQFEAMTSGIHNPSVHLGR